MYNPGILIHFKTVGDRHYAVISDGGIYRTVDLDDPVAWAMFCESMRQTGLNTPENVGTYEYFNRGENKWPIQ